MLLVFYGGSLVEQAGMATTYGFSARYGASTFTEATATAVLDEPRRVKGGGRRDPSWDAEDLDDDLRDEEECAVILCLAVYAWVNHHA